MPYRILSLDGGGIRGVYTAVILERLEREVPGFLDDIDLFAGTSTGAILALGLAAGKKPGELIELYRRHGREIFSCSMLGGIGSGWGWAASKYGNKNLKDRLKAVFDAPARRALQLRDLRKVLVAAVDLNGTEVVAVNGKPAAVRSWRAKFFHNFPNPPGGKTDGEESVVDVALRSSAAPTYFPSYGGYVDGGVVANNPSMAAVAQAVAVGKKMEDLRLLSVGTGINLKVIPGAELDWGKAHWGKQIMDLVVDATGLVAHYQCQQILKFPNYWRLNDPLGEEIDLDDCESVERLITLAGKVDLTRAVEWARGDSVKPRAPGEPCGA
ncbi:MAG: patatin-like phospholipase family protein [Elusimicrobiota bacterium]|jgi:patatin-like phospholipase/acyl hydrolase